MNILTMDDHDVVRTGLMQVLSLTFPGSGVFEANGLEQACAVLQANDIDIVLVDLSLKGESGLDLLTYSEKHNLECKFIVVSMHDTEPYVSRALSAGALGYLSKHSLTEELEAAIQQVLNERRYISRDVVENTKHMQRHQEQTGFSSLTEKELEVFRLLALGHAVKHVAKELPIATATAHVHRRNILTKLELNSNFDLTKLAFSLGLITPEDLYC